MTAAAAAFAGRVCLVTGGAQGMGRAFVRALVAAGARVAACDLDAAALGSLAGDDVVRAGPGTLRCDTVDVADAAARAALVERVAAELGPVELLVNNAGVGASGPFEAITGPDWDWLRAIDLDAPIDFARLVLPGMRARRRGWILNVASMSGLMPQPYVATYVAAKYALVGISRALDLEVRPYGVCVTVGCPGPVRTGIMDRVRARQIDLSMTRAVFRFGISAEVAVERMLRATARGKAIVVPNRDVRAFVALYRILPGPIDALLRFGAHRAYERQRAEAAGPGSAPR